MAVKGNRRTQMTKMLLKEALIELMEEMPFRKISIKDICERADLNRTTFYLHYTDQETLLRDIERNVQERTITHLKNVSPTADAEGLIEVFLRYVHENDKVFRLLLCNEESASFRQSFVQNTLREIRPNLPDYGSDESEKYILTFLMQGSAHIIITWINANYDMKEGQLAHLIYALCDSVQSGRF